MANPNPSKPSTRVNRLKKSIGQTAISIDDELRFNSDALKDDFVQTGLGLGTAAVLNTGTAANQVVKLDGSAKLPAVDGSQLTNLPGGGGGTGLPVWTHAVGGSATPADGTFTTNVDTINGTTTLHLANTPKNGEALYGKNLAYLGNAVVTLTESGGGSIGWIKETATLDGEFVVMTGHLAYAYGGDWSGDYIFSFAPAAVAVPIFQAGWVANNPAGADRTVSVELYTGGAGLAGIDATADAQIVALTKKFIALEAALAEYQLPNA